MAAHYFGVPFAVSGDKLDVPVPLQPDGSISYTLGWGPDYELVDTAPGYKPVGRAEMNGMFNAVTAAIGEMQFNGFPMYNVAAKPYPINAVVRFTDNKTYRSTIANNNSTPGTNADWADVNAVAHGAFVSEAVFTTPGTFTWVCPAGVYFVQYKVVGAGGSGRNSQSFGPGGGGGGVSEGTLAVVPGTSYTVVVGAGGVGVSYTVSGSPGNNGGASSFNGTIIGPGGQGGTSSGLGGPSGIGTGGAFNYGLGDGESSYRASTDFAQSGSGGGPGGAGACSQGATNVVASAAGKSFGGGGGGRMDNGGLSGAGAGGAVFLRLLS